MVKRGDIYFVAGTEATGSEQRGNRPAVIVSNNIGNRYAPIVEVVYLTTQKETGFPTHVFISSTQKPSIAICEQIVTVCKSRLEHYIGRATEEEMRGIDKALQRSLGIYSTGGNAMQITMIKITMITPFGEMKFDIPPEKAIDLIQRAFHYAVGQEPQKAAPTPPLVAQEQPKAPEPIKKPPSRVERIFGDFKATGEAETKAASAGGQANTTAKPEEYRGFLLIKCDRCGKVHGFCSKTAITSSRCECGQSIELRSLRPVHLKCKCGREFTYKTNITEERFDYPCLNCGSPVDLELNKRGDTYVTIGR